MMEINRRQFLKWLTIAPAISSSFSLADKAEDSQAIIDGQALYASASQGDDGLYYIHVVNSEGHELMRHSVPDRAHQVISHPTRPWILGIARRPGTFIEIVDYQTLTLVKRVESEPGYHLYGHAQVTDDGRYIITTENNMATDEGMVIVRDIEDDFAVVKRFRTQGIGPHQVILSRDQKTLVVANGGIRTEGREKTNLDTMKPSLVYLDAHSGAVLEQAFLADEYHQCSIRHIDLSAQGQVIIAMQYQGHPADQVPIMASHRRGEPLRPLEIPPALQSQLDQYCGSACFDQSGLYAAVSAPRGDQVMIWDMMDYTLIGTVKTKDGCGLARTHKAGEFIVSTGRGRLYHVDVAGLERKAIRFDATPVHWDNHLFPVIA